AGENAGRNTDTAPRQSGAVSLAGRREDPSTSGAASRPTTDSTNPADAERAAADPAPGTARANAVRDVKGAQLLFAELARSATIKGGLDDLAARLAGPAGDRVARALSTMPHDDLDARAEQFQQAWMDQYQREFRVKEAMPALGEPFMRLEPRRPGPNAGGAATPPGACT